jgi:integrase
MAKEKMERVLERRGGELVPVKHLYRRMVLVAAGRVLVGYYGIFVDWKGVRRKFPLGTNEAAAKQALAIYEARNVKREDFDLDKVKPKPQKVMTIAEWSDVYFTLEQVQQKKSLEGDRPRARVLKRHLGDVLLPDLAREDLFRYVNARRKEFIMRAGKMRKTPVSDGTIKNELSLLRRMRNLALEQGIKASMISFKGIGPKPGERARSLSTIEKPKLLLVMSQWFRWLFEAALETALSQSDLLRLTDAMIDEEAGVIIPTGGRKKTGVRQVAPLTDRTREILAEIREYRRQHKITPKNGLVFTRLNGAAITKSQIGHAMREACRKAGIEDFRFHDLRHTAKTGWARAGISVEAAMLAAGHNSVAMHNHYVHLQANDISKFFGTARKNVPDAFPDGKTA